MPDSPARASATSSEPARSEHLRASPPLFASPLLDRMTRVHPIVPLALFGPIVVALTVWGTAGGLGGWTAGWLAFGYLLWTLTEYWLHRVVFHFEPERGLGQRLHYLIHGVHHDHPNDSRRLVMPPSASIPLATIFCGAFYLLFGDPTWRAVSGGFLAGYVVYDTVHWLVHHRVPRGRIGRILRERHMRHHFQDHTRGFGVSAPYWDLVFGTAGGPRRAGRAAPVGAAHAGPTPERRRAGLRRGLTALRTVHRRG